MTYWRPWMDDTPTEMLRWLQKQNAVSEETSSSLSSFEAAYGLSELDAAEVVGLLVERELVGSRYGSVWLSAVGEQLLLDGGSVGPEPEDTEDPEDSEDPEPEELEAQDSEEPEESSDGSAVVRGWGWTEPPYAENPVLSPEAREAMAEREARRRKPVPRLEGMHLELISWLRDEDATVPGRRKDPDVFAHQHGLSGMDVDAITSSLRRKGLLEGLEVEGRDGPAVVWLTPEGKAWPKNPWLDPFDAIFERTGLIIRPAATRSPPRRRRVVRWALPVWAVLLRTVSTMTEGALRQVGLPTATLLLGFIVAHFHHWF